MHEIPEEHQLPFSELTESFNSLEEYMSSSQDEQLFYCFARCEPSFFDTRVIIKLFRRS